MEVEKRNIENTDPIIKDLMKQKQRRKKPMSYKLNKQDPFRRPAILARRTKTHFTVDVMEGGKRVQKTFKYGKMNPLAKTGRSSFGNIPTPMKISNRFALLRRLAFLKDLYTAQQYEAMVSHIMSGQANRYLMLDKHPTKGGFQKSDLKA